MRGCKTLPSEDLPRPPAARWMVSALTGEGIGALTEAIQARLSRRRTVLELLLDPADGAASAGFTRNSRS